MTFWTMFIWTLVASSTTSSPTIRLNTVNGFENPAVCHQLARTYMEAQKSIGKTVYAYCEQDRAKKD